MNPGSGAHGAKITPQINELRLRYFLLFIYLVVASRLWIMPIGLSLSLDETLTYWNVMKGTSEVLPRSAASAGHFQLYMFITALSAKFFGLNEFGLRLPSIVASIGSSWLMFRLGQRFSDTETGIFAAILFVCMPAISWHAYNARPYSLVVICALWAVWQLVKLHDSGEWRYIAGYTVAAASMVYMQLISVPFLIVLWVYSFLQFGENNKSTKQKVILAHALSLLMLTPILYKILLVMNEIYNNSALYGKETPKMKYFGNHSYYFIRAIFTDYILCIIAILLTCTLMLKMKISEFCYIFNNNKLFMLMWLMIPVTSVYLISTLFEYQVFLSRYYIVSYLALVLILAAVLQKIRNNNFRYIAFISFCIVGVFYCGGIKIVPFEDWRGALTAVKEITEPTRILLLFNSGLAETIEPGWELQTADHHLLSPLAAYPVNTRVVALPVALNNKSRPYLEAYVAKEIASVKRFAVVLRIESNSGDVDRWIQDYAKTQGFIRCEIGNFIGVLVVFYEQKILG